MLQAYPHWTLVIDGHHIEVVVNLQISILQ